MTWAQGLKRVFNIDIETCPACGGALRIIICIEDREVIEKILTHLDEKAGSAEAPRRRCSSDPGGEPDHRMNTSLGSNAERRGRVAGALTIRMSREIRWRAGDSPALQAGF